MKSWHFLKENDIVDVVAPGSGTTGEELQSALNFLRTWKLQPRVSPDLFSGHPYLSNSDEFRFKDLRRALLAKDSSAVWCLRGGYGAVRLVPKLLKLKALGRSKLFIGYSDMTTLHIFLTQKWKWGTCHGPLLDGLGKGKYENKDVLELKQILFGKEDKIDFMGIKSFNKKSEKIKKIEASIIAGNLMVLANSLGTKCELSAKNKILAIEESGERGYRVDRLLTHLLQSKALLGVKAVIFADFLGGDESNGKNFVATALHDFASQVDFPVFSNLPMGHGLIHRPLFLGPKAKLQKSSDGFSLEVLSGGVI